MAKRRFHKYPTSKTAQCIGTLLRLIHNAGGDFLHYLPEKLDTITGLDLIKILAPNKITFTSENNFSKEIKEVHQTGHLSIENEKIIKEMLLNNSSIDAGFQVSFDGRIWLCVNGIAFIRFKPKGKQE